MDLKEFKKLIASYISESFSVGRGKRASTIKFLKDIKDFKRVNVYFDIECEEPKILQEVQYYNLNESQLISYFSYRTSVRKKQIPTNNYAAFLQIYLAEILSSLYSDEYANNLKLIKYLQSISPKTLKFTNLLRAAYESLYLQHYDVLKDSNYIDDIDIPLFIKKEIVYENGEWSSPVCFVIFNIFNLDTFSKYNKNTKYIFEKCFSYIYYRLKAERFTFNTNDYKEVSFDRFFENTISETSYTPYDNLNTYSRLDINIVLIDNIYRKIDYFIQGVHKSVQVHFRDEFRSSIRDFAQSLLDIIVSQCGGTKLPQYEIDSEYISYKLKSRLQERIRVQSKLNELFSAWLKDNIYLKRAFYLPYEQFIEAEYNDELDDIGFSFNSDEIDKIRVASSNIQDKLIVEEADDCFDDLASFKEIEEEEREKDYCQLDSLLSSTDKNEDSSLVDDSSNSPFKSLYNKLSECERVVTTYLLNGEADKARTYAEENNEMLTLLIDSINTKSDEIIEDVIIENDEIIEDYREDLLVVFNKG